MLPASIETGVDSRSTVSSDGGDPSTVENADHVSDTKPAIARVVASSFHQVDVSHSLIFTRHRRACRTPSVNSPGVVIEPVDQASAQESGEPDQAGAKKERQSIRDLCRP